MTFHLTSLPVTYTDNYDFSPTSQDPHTSSERIDLRSSNVSMLLRNTMDSLYSVRPSSIGITEHFLCPQLPLYLFSWFICYSGGTLPICFISSFCFHQSINCWCLFGLSESLCFSQHTQCFDMVTIAYCCGFQSECTGNVIPDTEVLGDRTFKNG